MNVMQEPLLKYRLPAVACPPPLLLQVTPVLPAQSGGAQQSVLFVVQYCVSPHLRGVLRSATFTLQCPRILGEPKKASHLTTANACLPASHRSLCRKN